MKVSIHNITIAFLFCFIVFDTVAFAEPISKKVGRHSAVSDPTITLSGMSEDKATTAEDTRKDMVAKQVTEAAIKDGTQKFEDLPSLQAKIFFVYSPTALYEIFCREGHITDIQLQPGEEPLYVGGGDTIRWMIDKAQSGSGDAKQWHIFVKPLKSKITTNLVITTDKHAYQIRVRAANFFNPFIGWTYPAEEKSAFLRQQAQEKKRADENISLTVAPDKINFNYTIEAQTAWYQSAYSWTPKLAFDDGTRTYIQMSVGMKSGEAPALFVKDEEGVNLVNYRVKDNYYIVDRIFDQAELRCGLKDIVVISRNTKNK
jgi:type IV secretion system protein TrbG